MHLDGKQQVLGDRLAESLDGNALGQIPRLVHIRALGQGRVVRQQLQRDGMDDRR